VSRTADRVGYGIVAFGLALLIFTISFAFGSRDGREKALERPCDEGERPLVLAFLEERCESYGVPAGNCRTVSHRWAIECVPEAEYGRILRGTAQ
jgi:hypothetical protein